MVGIKKIKKRTHIVLLWSSIIRTFEKHNPRTAVVRLTHVKSVGNYEKNSSNTQAQTIKWTAPIIVRVRIR